ncbi:MAG: hypothetical protein ABIP55_06620 [Tepidisphaeraceae bacterium]
MRAICTNRFSPRTLPAALASGVLVLTVAGPTLAFDRTFNVSLVSQFNPPIAPIANHYADLARQGNLVALGSVAGDGVAFVNITNPAVPSFYSYYNPLPAETGGHFQDIEFKGNYAFCAIDDVNSTNGGIHILDMTNLISPVKVSQITQANSGFNKTHTIFLDGDFLYATSNAFTTVKVFNVANPLAPVFVRDIITTGAVAQNLHQVTVKNGRLYTSNVEATGSPNFGTGLLEIYNITDVASPSWTAATRRLGSFNTTIAGRNHSSWPSEDGNLVAVCRENADGDVEIWDISNLAAPFMASQITKASAGVDAHSPHNPVIVGDTLYVSWYQAGLQIFNIRNAASPVHIGAYDTFVGGDGSPGPLFSFYDGNWGLDVTMGIDKILLSNIDDGLYIVNATNAFKKVWNYGTDNAGKWQENSRWASDEAGGGPFPNSSEMSALFTNAAAGTSRTVTIDGLLASSKPRVAGIEFSSSLNYTLNAVSGGAIEMNTSSGSAAITVLGSSSTGINRINAPLELSDNLVVTNNSTSPGVRLFLSSIQGTGKSITFGGAGISGTALTTASPSFTGSIVLNSGGLYLQHPQAVNAQPITLAGGTLTLENNASSNFVSHITVTGDSALQTINAGSGSGQIHRVGDVTVNATKKVFLSRFGLTNLEMEDVVVNGTMQHAYDAGAGGVKMQTLTVGPAGKMDVGEGRIIVTTALVGTWTGSAYNGISGMIDTGRGNASNALWDGVNGIVTTDTRAINNNDLTSIGVATAGQLGRTTFAGHSVDADDVLVLFTWGGDANLDGKINIDDYGQIDFNVGSSGSVFGWYNGDFNYDGKINIDDYGIIDFNVTAQTGTFPTAGGIEGVAAIPEPAGVGVLLLAGLALGRRRRHGGSSGSSL